MAKSTNPETGQARQVIVEDIRAGAFPAMNPDIFEDFVTWLYERVDLRSFAQSRADVRLSYYRKFILSTAKENPKRLQLILHK